MSLMKKILGGGRGKEKDGNGARGESSQFAESRSANSVEQTKSRNAPRRELIQMTLRETMRRHGIPSDWIDCRSLSVLTRQHKSGMHVQFLVRKADHQILPWLHALQESFWEQILRTDPKAHEWLFSVGWEFYGKSEQGPDGMPRAGSWAQEPDTQTMEQPDAGDTLPHDEADEEVATDLQKLQELMTQPAELMEMPDTPRKP
jgi:hypothetical protein